MSQLDEAAKMILSAMQADDVRLLGDDEANGARAATMLAHVGDGQYVVLRALKGADPTKLVIDAAATAMPAAQAFPTSFPIGPRTGEHVYACWWCAQLCECGRPDRCDCRYAVPVGRTEDTPDDLCDSGCGSLLCEDGRRICRYHFDRYHELCADGAEPFASEPMPQMADGEGPDVDDDCPCRYCEAARPQAEEEEDDDDEGGCDCSACVAERKEAR